MANNTLVIAVNSSDKTADLTGIIAVREILSVTLTDASVSTAENLRLGVVKNGVLLASCLSFTGSGGTYTGELDLNTEELVDMFSRSSQRIFKEFTVAIWDVADKRLLISEEIDILNNPYSEDMEDPTPVDPIGGVTEYAPLANGVTNGDTHTHSSGDGGTIAHSNLSGIGTLTHAQLETSLSAKVANSLFTAQSIASAVSSGTPVAVTIGEQQLVGRITGGNVAGLTATSVRTLLNVEDGATADMTSSEIEAIADAIGYLKGDSFSANGLLEQTAPGVFGVAEVSAFAKTLIDDADAATARATLELGSMAEQDASGVAITGGTAVFSSLECTGDYIVLKDSGSSRWKVAVSTTGSLTLEPIL